MGVQVQSFPNNAAKIASHLIWEHVKLITYLTREDKIEQLWKIIMLTRIIRMGKDGFCIDIYIYNTQIV